MNEKIINICQVLNAKEKDISQLKNEILDGFLEYWKKDLDSAFISKKESATILKNLKTLNSLKIDIKDFNKELIRGILNGEYEFSGSDIIKKENIKDFFSFFPELNFSDKKKVYIDCDEITPIFIKDLLKQYNWNYKDLANNIGAVDTTIRNWVSTGNIPEWAKKSISYIVTIEKLKRKEEYLKNDLDEVRNSISFLINFANEKDDYDE
ncbi:hypothetical protein HKC13_001832 [Campylobacter coli]|nr:hypothetical protein [Campylobacter coli]MBX0383115.1 hypothetical protein [Campylobacter coli]MBX0393472.1 hypothetical protein [Campylobacter coli]MBX1943639.1 hypothetical protein [Campylobacter coli]MBX2414549.1 hypothetical protein [Campylobacter coli]